MGFALNLRAPADGGLAAGRVLLLCTLVATLISTSATIGFEFASYIAFAALPEPRRRFIKALRSPIVIGLLPFAVVVFAATFWGATSWPNALGALSGWRRMLLLPLAAAVFDDGASKRLVCKVFLITCAIAALFSFTTYWFSIFLPGLSAGIAFHNYATQGIAFSLAMIVCGAALMRPDAFVGDWLLGDRRIVVVVLAMMTVDVVFVLVGRSGYLSVVVMGVAIVTLLATGTWRKKALAGLVMLVCVAAVLASSTHVRMRIAQALHEIETAEQAPEASSLGYRVIFAQNTIRMVRDHPLFGVGTGGFHDGYQSYVEGVSGWKGGGTGDPHDQFLKILGEQGLVGFAALLFFIVRALTSPAPSPFRELAAAALLGWCATSLANSHFSTFAEGRLLFFWLGAMLGQCSLAAESDAATPSPNPGAMVG